MKISRIKDLSDFLNFYSPFRPYSYKPLAGETYYFLIRLFNNNRYAGHIITFITYFIGLIFLYKIIKLLTANQLLAKLSVLVYGTSFIHVFQLYWFATYQEIAVFAFLAISFYSYLIKKNLLSAFFFILALLSKETAILYAPFFLLFVIINYQNKIQIFKKQIIPISVTIIIAGIFWCLYRYSLDFVTREENYKITWNLRLLFNNGMWYFLWGLGFPNFLPDYLPSIFSRPLPAFWRQIGNLETAAYFYLLIIYLILLFIGFIITLFFKQKNTKKFLIWIIYSLINFFIFLGPILFFRHKWMIRLTMPLIFISFSLSIIFNLLITNKSIFIKYFGWMVLGIYLVWNYLGINVHEVTSTYFLENKIYENSFKYFKDNRLAILQHNYIYFKDGAGRLPKGWNGSEKLKLSFSNNNFTDFYFPEKKITAIYQCDTAKIPEDAFIVQSDILLKQ